MKRMSMLFSIALSAAVTLSAGLAASAYSPDVGMHSADSIVHPFVDTASIAVFEKAPVLVNVSVMPTRTRTANKRVFQFIEQPFQTFAVLRSGPLLPDIVIST